MSLEFSITKADMVECQKENLNTKKCNTCEDKFICLTSRMGVESIGETKRKSGNVERFKLAFSEWEYDKSRYDVADSVTEAIETFVEDLVVEVEVDLETHAVSAIKINNKNI